MSRNWGNAIIHPLREFLFLNFQFSSPHLEILFWKGITLIIKVSHYQSLPYSFGEQRDFLKDCLTVSLALSNRLSSSHQVMCAGGRDPTDWHNKSYFFPAVIRLLFPKIDTSIGLTERGSCKWKASLHSESEFIFTWAEAIVDEYTESGRLFVEDKGKRTGRIIGKSLGSEKGNV